MIMIRGGADEMFESAYFVIRPEKERVSSVDEKDMVSEAMRIISETENDTVTNKKKLRRSVLRDIIKFMSGFICGAGVAALVALIMYLE